MSKRILVLCALLALTVTQVVAAESDIHVRLRIQHVDYFQGVVDGFLQQHPGISITVDKTSGKPEEQLLMSIASGTAPDIFHLPAAVWYSYKEYLYPIGDFIAMDESSIDDFLPPAVSQYLDDGVYYGLPYDYGYRFVVYNKDMFAEAGLPSLPNDWESPEWTFDDIVPYDQKLTKVDSSGAVTTQGVTFPDHFDHGYLPFLYSNGARLLQLDNGRLTTGLATPQAVDLFEQLYYIFVERGVKLAWFNPFLNGTAATNHLIPGQIGVFKNTIGDSFEWDIAPWPAGEAGHKTAGGGLGWFIYKGCENPELAWEVLQELTSHEAQRGLTEDIGMMAPARLSILGSDAYMAQMPFDNKEVLKTGYQYIESEAFRFKDQEEYFKLVETEMRNLITGKQSVPQTTFNIQMLSRPILSEVEY